METAPQSLDDVINQLQEKGGFSSDEKTESLMKSRTNLDAALIRVWQARTILESSVEGGQPTQDILAHNHRLRASAGLDNTTRLQSYVAELQQAPDATTRRNTLEQQLFTLGAEKEESLKNFPLKALSPQILAYPDNDASSAVAQAFIREGKFATIADLLTPEGMKALEEKDLDLPMMERLIESVRDSQTIALGIECAKSEDATHEYLKRNILSEKERKSKVCFTPSYENAYKTIINFMLQGGENRSVARSMVWGPPGRGKTEFYRSINKMLGKETFVISGRPYLGFEELIAAPELVSQDPGEKYRQLATMYTGMDDYTVANSLMVLSHKYIDSLKNNSKDTVFTRQKEQEFRKYWFNNVAGLNAEMAAQFAELDSLDEVYQPNRLTTQDNEIFSKIKSDFLARIAALGAEVLSGNQEERMSNYLSGLILTADKAGMNVLIDEAEKIYGDNAKNQSFAGLEDFLNAKPGSTFTVGNINHRLSDDFFIDLTMNEPNVPDQISSRFGTRKFYFEEEIIDRLGISAVKLSDKKGEQILSTKAEEKMVFLLSNLWRALDQKAKKEGVTLDLRILQSILNTLVSRDESTKVSVAKAVDPLNKVKVVEPPNKVNFPFAEILANYPAFQEAADVMAFLEDTEPDIVEKLPILLDSLVSAPRPIRSNNLRMHTINPDDIKSLAKNLDHENVLSGTDSLPTKYGYVAKQGNILLCLGKQGEDVLHQTVLPEQYANWQLTSLDTWGSVAVLKSADGKQSVVVDVAGITGTSSNSESRILLKPMAETNTTLSPDGMYLFTIPSGTTNTNEITLHQILNTTDTQEPLRISLPSLQNGISTQAHSVECTPDGNYAIVRMRGTDGIIYSNILIIPNTIVGKKAKYALKKCVAGPNWNANTFENVLYLLDTTQGKERGIAFT